MKTMTTLEDLFVSELKDIYNAERQLLKALPKMAKSAASEKLRAAIEDHLEQTEQQVERLVAVFQSLELTARGSKCEAMEGLIQEGAEIMEEDLSASVRDAALIAAANKVEHYEIASYGTLVSYARLLGHEKATKLLETTLEEEKAADRLLTELAESEINIESVSDQSGDAADDESAVEDDEEEDDSMS